MSIYLFYYDEFIYGVKNMMGNQGSPHPSFF